MALKSRLIFIVATLVTVTGCSSGTSHNGAAAVVAKTQISQKEVTSQLAEVVNELQSNQAPGQPTDPVILSQQIVNRLVLTALIDQAMTDLQLSVDEAKITSFQEGIYAQYGQEAVQKQLLTTQAIPASEVDNFFKLLLSEEAISEQLNPTGNEDARNATFSKYMGELATSSNITVSPRYGSWDETQFKVTGVDNVLSTLVSAE